MSTTQETSRSTAANVVLGIVVLAGITWVSSIWWLPKLGLFSNDPTEAAAASADGTPLTMLELSQEALATLGIEVKPLQPTLYERTISIPGHTTVVPGIGRREVTSPSSGIVSAIFVRQGEMVTPNQPLFEVKLIHDEGIKVQVELLDALAEREVVDADLRRLQELERRSPGAIQGTRLLEKEYRRQHLNHLIASRRQMLFLLGLPKDEVDAMIESHLSQDDDFDSADREHLRTSLLLEKVTIATPDVESMNADSELFLVEKLNVVQGQHVESGNVLCQIGDYQTLHIIGEAFERDSDAIRRARDNGWPITAVVERRGREPALLHNLRIADIAPQVDARSRSMRFYVELENTVTIVPALNDQPARPDWAYRPGRRMELRVPTERIPNALKVPVTAVAEDGLDHFVFQASGNIFNRRSVKVLHRDEDFVVIEKSRFVTAGVPIAMNGAYQLQLALLNASMDPAAVAHGHAH